MAISENHLYKKVYAKGEKVFCKHIVVYVLTDYHASRLARENPLKKKVNRMGITVSKKIGKAVTRVRVRRIIREAYRLIEDEQKLVYGNLLVIAARAKIADAKMQDVKKDMLWCLKRVGLVEKNELKDEVQ